MKPIKSNQQASNNSFFRINDQIKVKEVRVIDENGKMMGVMSVFDGIKLAKEVDLDLIEVSPNANPPVCKISNFGKMKYEFQKKISDAKKKQKVVEVKFDIKEVEYEMEIIPIIIATPPR